MLESEYIRKFKAGDRQAFNALFEMHWADLVSYAALIAGEPYSKDIVHDIFVKLWINKNAIKDCDSLRPYLMRAVYNSSLNSLRNKAKFLSLDKVSNEMIDFLTAGALNPDESDIIKKLYTTERNSEVEAAIASLPPKCQEIFRMTFMEGKSHKEVADSLGLSLSTVDNQVYKAMKKLKDILSEATFLLVLLMLLR